MATAVIAGIVAYGAAAGAGGAIAGYAVAIGITAAAATAYTENEAKKAEERARDSQVQLGDQGSTIDKSALQKEAQIGDLELGEDDTKTKRKKGKAKFKIALDEKAADLAANPSPGIQISSGSEGVQL